ncbi:hypothetical protein SASPL_124979 [Salvia splendens]|uniref:Cell division control protein n=1 Tax=Salvia splendens TaxID=180675 RepID=A0A8X8ZQC1_SALSN|nr:hypothetical protein SASPL_124979 [Salvia splendens]
MPSRHSFPAALSICKLQYNSSFSLSIEQLHSQFLQPFSIYTASVSNPGTDMPAFSARRHSPSSDPTSETRVAVTPRKSRLRSDPDAAIASPLRKSPRLCKEGSPNSSPKIEVIRKCLKSSLNLSGSPEKKQLSEDFVERQTWDPREETQLRAVNEALHLSTAPPNVVCRENEKNQILDFCSKCVKEEKAGSLYVCGCPGTGKTLSMEKVKVMLVDWANKEGVQPPDVLSINCTTLANMSEIFSKVSSEIVFSTFTWHEDDVSVILVVADELDYLITKDRSVLHDLFMLTTMPFSRCILLGVANAIDLADMFIPKLQSLNCKPMVITFCAYSKDQIINILQERLKALPYTVFQPQALELCARKVAAASGDMRKALAVCRSAIEMLIGESMLSSVDGTEDQQKPAANNMTSNQVRIHHVAAALSKVYKSPVVDTIISLPQHQQIILCSAVKLFREGKKGTTLGELNKYYVDVCKSTMIPPVGILELSSMCRVLDDQGILKLGQSREDKLRRVTLNVDGADIVFALQGVRFFRNCLK